MRLYNTNICFVTSKQFPALTENDRLAAIRLQSGGARVIPAIWNDSSVDWRSFDAVVIRSPWDYHRSPQQFHSWLHQLESSQVRVWNPLKILRWNMDKRYLQEIQRKGAHIPRTLFLDRNTMFDLSDVRKQSELSDVVIKPIISASSWNTWRCSLGKFTAADQQQVDSLLEQTGVMIQEYLPEVVSEGEWSLIFFGKEFSHAVRKFPTSGDFRVQEEFGGKYIPERHPPAELVRQAGDALGTISEPLLYSRIDGIVRAGRFIIMELELLEPALFFDAEALATTRFCERLSELMSAGEVSE